MGRLRETNRVKETKGGDRKRLEAGKGLIRGKQEQLVQVCKRQRSVSGSKTGKSRCELAGTQEEESKGKAGRRKSRVLKSTPGILL